MRSKPSLGFGQHCLQKIRPQFRQWCLRMCRENRFPQSKMFIQCCASESSTHTRALGMGGVLGSGLTLGASISGEASGSPNTTKRGLLPEEGRTSQEEDSDKGEGDKGRGEGLKGTGLRGEGEGGEAEGEEEREVFTREVLTAGGGSMGALRLACLESMDSFRTPIG